MTYVLLYIEDNRPCFIQGSLATINERLRTLWLNGSIDQEDWEYYQNWKLLALEDGVLTSVEADCVSIPHLEV